MNADKATVLLATMLACEGVRTAELVEEFKESERDGEIRTIYRASFFFGKDCHMEFASTPEEAVAKTLRSLYTQHPKIELTAVE